MNEEERQALIDECVAAQKELEAVQLRRLKAIRRVYYSRIPSRDVAALMGISGSKFSRLATGETSAAREYPPK
ncbi:MULTISPECIES: hypothetical protein [Corynebacterium]|uniref:hypothetical protein n=1 Tax=Corynebacterium TaxID=1716 RepID=UPI00205E03AE|nr:MAG TPA: Protein of unknown function (DUF1492) [Caudoviricetes sp.]